MKSVSLTMVSALLIPLSAALLASGSVSAQDGNYIDAVTPYAHHQLHRYRGDKDAQSPDTKHQRTYEPSAEVSRNLNRMLSQLLAGDAARGDVAEAENVRAVFAGNPEYRALLARQIGGDAREIQRNLDGNVLQSRLSELLERRNYAGNDPVDVLNAYLITAWRVVHDDRQNAHADAYRALRRAMRNSQIEAPDVARQQVAEMFGVINMLTLAAWRNAHDPSERESLRLGTLMLAKRMSGVDLQAVVLTDRGFARRN